MNTEIYLCRECGAPLTVSKVCQEYYDELACYTLSRQDPDFIHQYIVDAYAAQHIGPKTKPVTLAGALIGLYLFAEHDYTGREVQRVHMLLGNEMKAWPLFDAPKGRAAITVIDALNAPTGELRDRAIRDWAKAVWELWKERHSEIEGFVRSCYRFEIRPAKPKA